MVSKDMTSGDVLFETEGATLHLKLAQSAREKKRVGVFTGVVLTVADFEADYNRLSVAGVRFHASPETNAWGGKTVEWYDSEQNVLVLAGW